MPPQYFTIDTLLIFMLAAQIATIAVYIMLMWEEESGLDHAMYLSLY